MTWILIGMGLYFGEYYENVEKELRGVCVGLVRDLLGGYTKMRGGISRRFTEVIEVELGICVDYF